MRLGRGANLGEAESPSAVGAAFGREPLESAEERRLLLGRNVPALVVDEETVRVQRTYLEARMLIETDSPAGGHIEGLTLRLYDPQTHQWSLYWATSKSGAMGVPTIGEFKNGRGEFFDTEPSGPNGKSILCRFVWTNTNTDTPHFEQSFSEDGGKTWEVNWITDQTRVKDESDKPH